MDNLTFNELPTAVSQLFNKLNDIERLLLEKSNKEQPNLNDQWLDINKLCEYLPDKPAKATVYGWVHAGSIPNYKGSKKLRFSKTQIDLWLKEGKRKTVAELEKEAELYLTRKKG
jgi:excisionase family DNA binding protein